jgi:hypothetical protein
VNARAILVAALAVSAVLAAGERYRTPEPPSPVSAPSEVVLKAGAGVKGGAAVPSIDVEVVDAKGAPVAGLGIGVSAFRGGGAREFVRAATDASGRASVRGEGGRRATSLTVAFQADGGSKTVRAKLAPAKGGWELTGAPYKKIVDGSDEGDCGNLVKIQRPGDGRISLRFTVPGSLLECREVVYGSEKKVHELSRIDAIGKREVNVGDKNSYSPKDEEAMGLQSSQEFDKQFVRIDDPEIVGYVDALAKKVVAASDRPQMPVHVRVVNTDAVNAFVTAGGYVYVFTGLIKVVDNESQLAGVLAHETSHAIARHVTEGATRNEKAQTGAVIGGLIVGGLVGANQEQQDLLMKTSLTAAGVFTLKYDRRSEEEADLLGTQYLWNAGWDPEGIARFFQKMEKMGGSSPPAWLSTHPTHAKRVQNGIQAARAFLPPKERYLVDTDAFERIKAKTLKIQAPPQAPAK